MENIQVALKRISGALAKLDLSDLLILLCGTTNQPGVHLRAGFFSNQLLKIAVEALYL
jgi:hypothetical protein